MMVHMKYVHQKILLLLGLTDKQQHLLFLYFKCATEIHYAFGA